MAISFSINSGFGVGKGGILFACSSTRLLKYECWMSQENLAKLDFTYEGIMHPNGGDNDDDYDGDSE